MATTKTKPRSFTFTLTDDEHARLLRVAEADGRSAANWLRYTINAAFEALPSKPKKTRK